VLVRRLAGLDELPLLAAEEHPVQPREVARQEVPSRL